MQPLPLPNTWLLAIRALANEHRFSDAERKALAWLDHEPTNAQAWHMLASMREYQHDYRGAIEAATECLDYHAGLPQAWWYRGYQYLLFGLPAFAEDDFDKALLLAGASNQTDHVEVCHLMRAEARAQLGDYQGTLDDCAHVEKDASFWLHKVVTRAGMISHSEASLRHGHEDWQG